MVRKSASFYLMDHNALFHLETPLDLGRWDAPIAMVRVLFKAKVLRRKAWEALAGCT
jgi:hypothetical protein